MNRHGEKPMRKFDTLEGPVSDEDLFHALRESRNGYTVIFKFEDDRKFHAMITTLGVPIPTRTKPWRLSGQGWWDHVEKWETETGKIRSPFEPITVKHMIYEFTATYFPETRHGVMKLGKHVGDV